LHCAASCNNLAMVKFLVEHGACIFATTLSDRETAAEKCEEDEEGFDGCSEYLYSEFLSTVNSQMRKKGRNLLHNLLKFILLNLDLIESDLLLSDLFASEEY